MARISSNTFSRRDRAQFAVDRRGQTALEPGGISNEAPLQCRSGHSAAEQPPFRQRKRGRGVVEAGPAAALNERVIPMARGSVRVDRALARIEKSSAVAGQDPL